MMKTCSLCKVNKTRADFNKHHGRKDGLQTACRGCCARRSRRFYEENTLSHRQVTKTRRKKKRQELRKKIDEIKRRYSCRKCGENDTVCLEFHHIDPRQKDLEIATVVTYEWAWERV